MGNVRKRVEKAILDGIVEFSHTPFLQAEHSRLRYVELTVAGYIRQTHGDVSALPEDPGHRAITEAICQQDGTEAERLMRAHLSAHSRRFAATDLERAEWPEVPEGAVEGALEEVVSK